MAKAEPIEGLNDDERAVLIEALTVLRAARGAAWNKACDLADATERRRPAIARYDIEKIKRLARRLGGHAQHWMEE